MIPGIMHRGDITDPVVSPRPNTAMCTRRLRIVDGEHAIQPQMSLSGRILVSFNGEIYNFREVRQELIELGATFKTDSDTEVLATSLLVWGAGALQRLTGMYAFVALDLGNGEFLAARDPLGMKPLYVVQGHGGYLFCSEIRPLLKAAETGDVLLIPPGYMLSGKIFGEFKSQLQSPNGPFAQADILQLDSLLRAAVHRHIPSDLPVASLFSGGIDSTLITHYAREVRPEIPGYFLGGPEVPDYEFAAAYAQKSGLDFRMVPFNPSGEETAALIEDVVTSTELFEPEAIRSSICSYLLARQVHRDGFRVALCGEGADELFCGYLPLELVFADGNDLGRPVREQCLSQMNRTNLQRVDRCSMRWQLETRVPFLDPSVVNYAMNLDCTALVKDSAHEPMGKMPLRALYDLYPDQLPASIRDRSKVAFNQGAGFDKGQTECPWLDLAEESFTDTELTDARKEYAEFDLRTKEELLYLSTLAKHMDITRVPSLKGRTRLNYPTISRMDRIQEFVISKP